MTPWLYRDKPARMFIRRTKTRPTDGGEAYFTYRLVETRRVGRAVKQITLMNLGAHFTVPEAKWPAFVGRVQDTLHGQLTAVGDSLSESERVLADRCAAGIIARRGHDVASAPQPDDAGADVIGGVANEPAPFAPADLPDTGCAAGGTGVSGGRFQEVDLGTLDLVRARSVGVEHAAAISPSLDSTRTRLRRHLATLSVGWRCREANYRPMNGYARRRRLASFWNMITRG